MEKDTEKISAAGIPKIQVRFSDKVAWYFSSQIIVFQEADKHKIWKIFSDSLPSYALS